MTLNKNLVIKITIPATSIDYLLQENFGTDWEEQVKKGDLMLENSDIVQYVEDEIRDTLHKYSFPYIEIEEID